MFITQILSPAEKAGRWQKSQKSQRATISDKRDAGVLSHAENIEKYQDISKRETWRDSEKKPKHITAGDKLL